MAPRKKANSKETTEARLRRELAASPRAIRANAPTAATPILVITSFALSADEQKAKDAGATGYLAKPYSPMELLDRIRRILPKA